MDNYARLKDAATLEEVVKWAQYVQRLRGFDVTDSNNLVNVFMSGRKVGKIPTSSADVAADDRLGDFNYDTNYLYILVTGAVWRRITLGVW